MPKNLPLSTVLEKNKIAGETPYLIALEIDQRNPVTRVIETTIRVVNNDEDVTIGGETYVALPFSISTTVTAGSTPETTVTLQDVSGAFKQVMREYAGGVDFPVRVIAAMADNLTDPPEEIDNYRVTSSSVGDLAVTLRLGDDNILLRDFPKRSQLQDRCTWVYKGAQCKYAGALATCDYTLQGPNGCKEHNNTTNFGGFPGIIPINLTT